MLKKTLIAGAILAASTGVAFANGGSYVAPPAPHHIGFFYAGVGVSRDLGHFKTTSNYSTFNQITTQYEIQHQLEHDWSGSGFNGEGFLGYGVHFRNRISLAGEIFGAFSSLEAKYDTSFDVPQVPSNPTAGITQETQAKVRMTSTFGLAFLPGYLVTPSTTIYGRVAWVYSRFKINDNGIRAVQNTGVFPVGGLTGIPFTVKKNRSGVQLGLGIQTNVTKRVAIRGEYDWSYYGDINAKRTIISNGIVTKSRVKVRPQVDQFKLAAIYEFPTMA